MVTVERNSVITDSLREYRLYLDGNAIQPIRSGEKIILNIVPGKHVITAKMDWCRSNEFHFIYEESEEEIEIVVTSTQIGFRWFFKVYYSFIAIDDYLYICKKEDFKERFPTLINLIKKALLSRKTKQE